MNFDVGEGFSYTLSVAALRETDDVERKELEFSGDAIKVFVFVFVDLGK